MKKLLVVLASLLLVAGLAFTAMAADPVKFSGEFDYTIMSDFSIGTEGWGNNYVDIFMTVDEYNIVKWELWGDAMGSAVGWGHFWLESDVGAAFDLPIGLKTNAGNFAIWSRKYEVTGQAWERPVRPYARPLGVGAKADFNGAATLEAGAGLNAGGALLAIPEIGPASIEAYYLSQPGFYDLSALGGPILGADFIGGNVKAIGIADMIDFAAGVAADISDNALVSFYWGAGLALHYDMFTFGVSASGFEDYTFNRLAIEADAKFTDMVGATVAAGLFLDDPIITDTFGGADISLYLTPGASTWRVGYAITENGYAYGVNGTPLLEGGLYVSAGIDF